MKEFFRPEFGNHEKNNNEKKESGLYEFVEKNLDFFDRLGDIERKIFNLILKVEKKRLMFGEIDRRNFVKEIETLKSEESEILDHLIRELNDSGGISILLSNEKLYEAIESFDSENENNNEEPEKSDEVDKIIEEESGEYLDYCPNFFKKIENRLIKTKKAQEHNQGLETNNSSMLKDEDELRLEKVLNLLSNDKLKKSNQRKFDPQSEFLRISNFPRDEKKELIKKYRSELADQLFAIGEINSFLENSISKEKDVDLELVYSEFKEKARQYKLSQWQIERYKGVFKEFKKTIKIQESEWKTYNNKPINEVLKKIIGQEYDCKGKVTMENYKIATIFYVYNIDDFARIHSRKEVSEKLTKEDYEKSRMTGGFHQWGIIFINKYLVKKSEEEKETLIHEVKHRINEIIENGLQNNHEFEIASGIESAEDLEDYFKNELRDAIHRAKDEILAYFKTGEDIEEIWYKLVNKGGAYDYLNLSKYLKIRKEKEADYEDESEILKAHSLKEVKKICAQYKNKYEEILFDCMSVLAHLDIFGFSRDKIIGIFQTYSITEWKNIYRRLGNSGRFLREKKDNIERKLPEYSKKLARLNKKLDQFKKNSSSKSPKVSPYGKNLEEEIKNLKAYIRKSEEALSEMS